MALSRLAFALGSCLVLGCGSRGPQTSDGGDGGRFVYDGGVEPPMGCGLIIEHVPNQAGANHVLPPMVTNDAGMMVYAAPDELRDCKDEDQTCGDGLNPPSGGRHCVFPLTCRAFSTKQQRCSWVHNLEHGHLVLAYNCDTGATCQALVAQLTAFHGAAADGGRPGLLGVNGGPRVLVTPDPKLPANSFAAVVWEYSATVTDLTPEKVSQAIACVQAYQDLAAPEHGLDCARPPPDGG